jgi:SAM-dependent methyltransferase
MRPDIARQLLALNRKFYTDFGEAFSATRGRIQVGVRKVIESLRGDETILDLGCGNGELARTLARGGHRGAYLGLDFSLPLLSAAGAVPEDFDADFWEVDLTKLSAITNQLSGYHHWSLITSFATFHHIPSRELRLEILNIVHALLPPGGRFIHSNWQFLNSPRLRLRVKAWSEAELKESDVDENDYLLDWRSGGLGLRYVHHFNEAELADLAGASDFSIIKTFYSDGKEGDLAIYQTWKRL